MPRLDSNEGKTPIGHAWLRQHFQLRIPAPAVESFVSGGLDTKEIAATLVKEKGLVLIGAELCDFEHRTRIVMHSFVSRGLVQKGELRDGVRVWRLG